MSSKKKKSVKKHKRRSPLEYSQVMRESVRSKNPFTAFSILPKGLTVEIQDEEEEILLLVRRHLITNLKWVVTAIFMSIMPVFLRMISVFASLPGRYQLMGVILWYLLTLVIVMEGFLNWYFDMFIVTDERIIDIDFNNMIYRNVTSTKIDKVEDVTYTVSGAIPSMLDYGNVMIQTAGAGVGMDPQETNPHIEIYDTPHPAKVAKLINELILEEEQEKIEGRVR